MPDAVLRRALAAVVALLLWPLAAGAQPQTPPVDVATPLVARIVDHDIFTGRFEAADRVEIRARVSGYLDRVGFEDGDLVAKEDLLFVIDQRPFDVAIKRARALLEASKATRDLAGIEYERAEQLAAREVGTVQEADRTRAALTEAEAQVQVAEAELEQVELDFGFTEILAPFAGRMSDTEVDPGNLITGGAEGATLLGTLVRTDPIYFTFTTSEADYLRYARLHELGDGASSDGRAIPVAVRLMDEDTFVHQGRLNFVDNELDPNSGTIEGRALIPNPDGFIVPGLFGRMRLPVSGEYEAVLVPDEAILSDQARKIVMTVDAEGTVAPRAVTPGALYRGLRVVRDGLGPDDRIVVNGVQRAQPGAQVAPNEVEIAFREPAPGEPAPAASSDGTPGAAAEVGAEAAAAGQAPAAGAGEVPVAN